MRQGGCIIKYYLNHKRCYIILKYLIELFKIIYKLIKKKLAYDKSGLLLVHKRDHFIATITNETDTNINITLFGLYIGYKYDSVYITTKKHHLLKRSINLTQISLLPQYYNLKIINITSHNYKRIQPKDKDIFYMINECLVRSTTSGCDMKIISELASRIAKNKIIPFTMIFEDNKSKIQSRTCTLFQDTWLYRRIKNLFTLYEHDHPSSILIRYII